MSQSTRKSDKFIPYYFALFFVVVFAVNGVFVYMSTTSHSGVVTDRAYQNGLEYNETIAASNKQDQLGWQSTARTENGQLIFQLNDADNNVIDDAKVTAYFMRPTKDGMDQQMVMTVQENGGYQAALDLPVNGQWDVHIVAEREGASYQKHQRIVLP